MYRNLSVLLLFLALAAPTDAAVEATQSRFALHSSICVNLHHFLYHMARNELRGEEILRWRVRTYPEDRAITPDGDDADTWRRALEKYAEYAERSLLFSSELTRVKNECANGPETFPQGTDAESLFQALRVAMPVYEKYWWPRHDAMNRQRIAELKRYLARYENGMAKRLARDYESEWPEEPIRVDVSVYSGHHGAYATEAPNQVIFASGRDWYPGLLGLELLFHEAGHTHPLNRNVRPCSEAAAQAAGVEERRLWHAYLFYAVAEAAKAVFPEDYVPYPDEYGLWDNGFGEHYPYIKEAYSTERGLAEEMRLIHEARAAAD